MMVPSKKIDPHKIILLAPILFFLHVVEEFPNFVQWVNSLVVNNITPSTFVTVNVMGFIITLSIALLMYFSRDKFICFLTLFWLSFLMFSNGILHLAATLILRSYSPGTLTALFLYLPYFFWFTWLLVKAHHIKIVRLILTVFLGSLPMLCHGYFIIFEGRRLF
jgi:hypothetical protein